MHLRRYWAKLISIFCKPLTQFLAMLRFSFFRSSNLNLCDHVDPGSAKFCCSYDDVFYKVVINGADEIDPILSAGRTLSKDNLFCLCKKSDNCRNSVTQSYLNWKWSLDNFFAIRRARRFKNIGFVQLEPLPLFIPDIFLSLISEFTEIFTGLKVTWRKAYIPEGLTEARHHSQTQSRQFNALSLLKYLSKNRLSNECAVLGITWTDLYPTPQENFVLGHGSRDHCSAVVSFGRCEPKAWIKQQELQQPWTDIEGVDGALLWKMLKVCSHELCHVFGIPHCAFLHCAMNESRSVEQALSHPLFLCPICLRKLQKVSGFCVFNRYNELLKFLRKTSETYPYSSMQESYEWLQRMINKLVQTADDADT